MTKKRPMSLTLPAAFAMKTIRWQRVGRSHLNHDEINQSLNSLVGKLVQRPWWHRVVQQPSGCARGTADPAHRVGWWPMEKHPLVLPTTTQLPTWRAASVVRQQRLESDGLPKPPPAVFSSSQERQVFGAACGCTHKDWSAKPVASAPISWIIQAGSDVMVRNQGSGKFDAARNEQNSQEPLPTCAPALPVQATHGPDPGCECDQRALLPAATRQVAVEQ